MGKFINWLFENNLDNTSAKDRIFGEEIETKVESTKVEVSKLSEEERYLVKYIHVGSDIVELKIDAEELKKSYKENQSVGSVWKKYLEEVYKEIKLKGYTEEFWFNRYSPGYLDYEEPSNFTEFKKMVLNNIIKDIDASSFTKRVKYVEMNIMKKKEIIKYTGYEAVWREGYYFNDNFICSPYIFSVNVLNHINKNLLVEDTEEFETYNVIKQFDSVLKENPKISEEIINNSIKGCKIKIKETTGYTVNNTLEIDVFSVIKEDFYQYSHTVYIEKKRLYELIKNDSTFEEILEVK